jgi:alpha-beta hydrolase superfamily lysophospholipase
VDVLSHPLLTARFFPPRPGFLPDARHVAVRGARLACWRAAGAPLVLFFHGNGETADDARRTIGAELLGLGAGVFLAEQRGAGGSTGRQTFPALLDDAHAILAATGVPPERVVVFGRSIGSLAAIELAGRHRLAGLVLESGIADVGERIRAHAKPEELGASDADLDAAVRARFDHEAKLARHLAPILVLASGRDERIDRTHAARLAIWAGSDDKELVVFRRGRHHEVLSENRGGYLKALRGFLARVAAAS